MKRGVKFTTITVLLGALLLFSTLPAQAASNVNGILTQSFQYSDCIDYESQTTSSGVNSANVTTYNNTNYYSGVWHVCWDISFTDNQPHSGEIKFTYSDSTTTFLSFDENVGVNGRTVFFTNKSSFRIEYLMYRIRQSSWSFPGTSDITITAFTEADPTDPEYQSILNTISSRINTTNTRLNTINTSIGTVNTNLGSIITGINGLNTTGSLILTAINTVNTKLTELIGYLDEVEGDLEDIITEMLDQGITLDNIYSYNQARHDWDIPVESFSINWALFYNLGDSYQSIRNYDYWQKYPIFTVPSNTTIFSARGAESKPIDFIIGINQNIVASSVTSYFSTNYGSLEFVNHLGQFSPSYRFVHLRVSNTGNNNVNITYIGESTAKMIGIYLGREDNHIGISQSFYENWFSDEIQNTADDIDDIVDDFDDTAGDLQDLEDDAADELDSTLEDLDLNPDILSSESFISSGNFIKTMFDRLILNTPLQPILLLALTLGVASIFIGRNR